MIYFDNSATTRPSEQCIKAMTDAMEKRFANASSLHKAGVSAKGDIDDCKQQLSYALGCTPSQILLGPGGTFCNNLAIKTAVDMLKRRGNKIIISNIEHPSVRECADKYRDAGFEVVKCNPLTDDFEKQIDRNTILVSCMYVNNETGLILPAEKLKEIIEKNGSIALLHIDAVQAFGKIPVDVSKLKCDMLTVSAHKINGPKGIGALYAAKGVRISPVIFGGEQENSFVPGTYNSPAAAGFAQAVKQLKENKPGYLESLYKHFAEQCKHYDFIHINSFGRQASHIINVSFDGYLGENVLHFLEEYDIYASQGSACSSHSKNRTRTLEALGADKRKSDCSLRISFDHNNTVSQIDEFFKVCSMIPQKLLRFYK